MPARSRRSRRRLTATPFWLLLVAPGLASASEYRETSEFGDVAARVEEYAAEHGAANTLFVVDIDNTLLAMRDELGSDQWFEWQEFLLEHEPDSPMLVADSFGGLLKVQGTLFELGEMRPPQPDQPDRVRAVQELGVPTLVLTSRGYKFRPATQRELVAAGYDLAGSALETRGTPDEPYAPYRDGEWEDVGLTAEEAELFRLKSSPRLVSYSRGVFMVAGQHKGAMLLTLLHRATHRPTAVVYVDDHGRHVHRVSDALARRGVEATVFHYHREDDNVKRFRYGSKTEVDRRWRRLRASLEPAAAGEAVSEPAAAAR